MQSCCNFVHLCDTPSYLSLIQSYQSVLLIVPPIIMYSVCVCVCVCVLCLVRSIRDYIVCGWDSIMYACMCVGVCKYIIHI